MEDFIGILFIFIAIVVSVAQSLIEKAKQNKSRDEMSKRILERKESGADGNVRQARPKGAAGRSGKIEPGTSGKELIEALFGEGSADDDEGWVAVEAEKSKPAPARPQQGRPGPRTAKPASREAAQSRRQPSERERAQQEAARRQQAQARRQKEEQARKQQQSRQQVMAERQRRKQERQRQQQAARQSQQYAAPRRAQVPGETQLIPRSLDEARSAIVMAEILGPPKALKDQPDPFAW